MTRLMFTPCRLCTCGFSGGCRKVTSIWPHSMSIMPHISVSIMPGQTQLTRTPAGAAMRAQVLVMAMTTALLAL